MYTEPFTHAQTTLPFAPSSPEMVARINEFPWHTTALGPIDTWPLGLRTSLSILLGSRFPMQLLWGPEYIHFYNDAYLPIAADKHPLALGVPGAQIWPEVWDVVLPMLEQVRTTGEATWSNDQQLLLQRHGKLEEGYFTFSYGPIYGAETSVEGVFVAVNETTDRVINERRLRINRDLSVMLASATREADVYRVAAELFGQAAQDLPLALVYRAPEGEPARFAASLTGIDDNVAPPPAECWPLDAAMATRAPAHVSLAPVFAATLPPSSFGVPFADAMVLPLTPNEIMPPLGALVVGISPVRPLDEEYIAFLQRVGSQLAMALVAARNTAANEVELQLRDDFLSIAAHELKNPLTPIIGRLQLLRRNLARDGSDQRNINSATVALSAAQRMASLIDLLLDLSRLRGGQLSIENRAVNLNSVVQHLYDAFQSATNSHTLVVNTPRQPVMVRGDAMRLEQVGRNLISNAVKYSPDGGTVTVEIVPGEHDAQLRVTDQGLGIAPDALPRLFDRYYRADEVSSIHGLGVGLYVVSEIVRLHGGTIMVDSTPGGGSTFTVHLPLANNT